MATIKEIAEKSGYSLTTVSRLLNNDPNLSVSPKTKSKILKVANELGYWEKKDSNSIKYLFALLYRVNQAEHLQDEYFTELKNAIVSVCKENNIELTIYSDVDELIKNSDTYQGFLAVSTDFIEAKKLQKLHQVLPNGVFIDSNPAPKLFDSIEPNLALAVEDAIDRLTDKGYQSIGFIGNQVYNLEKRPRRDIRELTFAEYSRDKGVKDAPIFIKGMASVKSGYNLGKEVLQKRGDNLPKAFIVASDTLSVGVLQAFNEAGIKIPEQTAIISINNNDVAQYVFPALTSYNINVQEMSRYAVHNLVEQTKSRDRERLNIHVTMNTDLVIRKSFY